MLSDDSVELFCIKCHYQRHTLLTSPFIYLLAGGFSKIATRVLERRCLSLPQLSRSRAKSNFPKSGLSFRRPHKILSDLLHHCMFFQRLIQSFPLHTFIKTKAPHALLKLLKAHILEHTSKLVLHASSHIDLINYPRDLALCWPIWWILVFQYWANIVNVLA